MPKEVSKQRSALKLKNIPEYFILEILSTSTVRALGLAALSILRTP